MMSSAATADVASGVLEGAEPCQGCGPLSAATEAAKLQSDVLLSKACEAAVATADEASGELSNKAGRCAIVVRCPPMLRCPADGAFCGMVALSLSQASCAGEPWSEEL